MAQIKPGRLQNQTSHIQERRKKKKKEEAFHLSSMVIRHNYSTDLISVTSQSGFYLSSVGTILGFPLGISHVLLLPCADKDTLVKEKKNNNEIKE